MTLAYVALGSNLEQPAQQVGAALAALGHLAGATLLRHSSLYRTAPVGYADQPDFINAVALLDTDLPPLALLDRLFEIEQRFGRERSFRNAPRVLDLDLLHYDGVIMSEPRLTLPHPRMRERAFVMVPLAEIAPAGMLPGVGDVAALAAALDASGVERLDESRGTRQQQE
ncbi:2-amino-4-hydroxy-6-hydroxymethyldihydropteridine diphosphokinase [Chromobacterium subtsugae]|uniref:2-amino-4-hydroxy-6-hydroxymethyldihydropteridine pyrophosphokinase n=1 Tax=Chromobacterium subtsugae TaxID=251747 RepID=A0ABS7FB18_9NEIS|nr:MULTISPECIES: 2-amino-4-hydroxy-6-hydroxymethyldihydropteridine diphosphokinase [Chromobacterium]KUM05580.1 2-amino-4-hydroxy-6-hydroxymethyldihydropteridine pyrophosphokinase [Chromobacterium subtsugae]KZE85583.1 2-amino-4-hydroxy-6-hydroxymethyldihydropteridine pyrophosphokinase [Chromobacterium sp. F49]MBW7566159.1 2-amino-4-hydroxy-6-hydroxymethyldihydropteridine diphosphokinase [Chromobacterium subtsugae]MBW8287280.1 2-amino-4-hydroxy-6-hydroxymethyldihydropteridine diphosphokinase [Chr